MAFVLSRLRDNGAHFDSPATIVTVMIANIPKLQFPAPGPDPPSWPAFTNEPFKPGNNTSDYMTTETITLSMALDQVPLPFRYTTS